MVVYKNQQTYFENGITLIALVVTIVILIILATISVNLILNGGLIGKTESGAELHRREAAREKLSMTLVSAGLEKKMNPKYNQNEFLDRFILKDISKAKILGDVVVVDGYGFEIDRSVPKIGKYVGKEEELVFPELRLEKEIREDNKTAVIKIITKEEKNGISKIEILQDGFVIETYEYSNVKEEIVENYEVSRNGNYVVKVYSALSRTEMIEISELVANIKYSPNGSEEYKKEHTVQVSVDKTVDKVSSIKYQWTNTTEEPEESSFTESCTDGEKITKNEVTGSWYLWTLIETEGGKKRIEKSEAFNFDNKGPEVELTSTPTSETSFTLAATGTDEHSGIEKYEFYVEDKLVKTIEANEEAASFEVTDKEMGEYDCYVVTTDKVGNSTKEILKARTKMYEWEQYECITTRKYRKTIEYNVPFSFRGGPYDIINATPLTSWSFDERTGLYTGTKGGGGGYLTLYNGKYVLTYYSTPPGSSGSEVSLTTLYYIKNVGRAIISKDGPVFQDTGTWDVYSSEAYSEYSKGSAVLDTIYTTSATTYEHNKRNSDGYWYYLNGLK